MKAIEMKAIFKQTSFGEVVFEQYLEPPRSVTSVKCMACFDWNEESSFIKC